MTSISTHVLDTARGCPAAGVPVRLESVPGTVLGQAITDKDGRVAALGAGDLPTGRYRIVFDTSALQVDGEPPFFPEIVVTVEVTDASDHCHVPLLLAPFAYSTYRGS